MPRSSASRSRADRRGAAPSSRSAIVVAGQLTVALGALAASVEAGQVAGLDSDVGEVRGTPGTAWASTFEAITDLGGVWVVIAVSLLACALLVHARRYADALLVAVAALSARVLTSVLKVAFGRERPAYPEAIATEGTFAFPSGHASAATALYGALALLVLRSGLPRGVRITGAGGLALVIAAIGFSRVYLGVHYASDVLAGVLLGAACVALGSAVAARVTARHAAGP